MYDERNAHMTYGASAIQAQEVGEPSLREIEAFLVREARLLDERRFEEWMDLFTEEGVYWAPSRPNQENPLTEVSIFFDDRSLMELRIGRLRHKRIHIETPQSRTVRLLSGSTVESFDTQLQQISVLSKFMALEYRPGIPGGTQRVFGGDYLHTLKRTGDEFKIIRKKVTLINCDASFGPLTVYF